MPEGAPAQHDDRRVMPFLDHLEELRWRIIKSLIAVVVGAVASLAFSDQLLGLLLRPVEKLGEGVRLVNLAPLSMVLVRLSIALVAGLVVGLPVVVFELWQFIRPGLYRHERRAVPWVLGSALVLFVIGALLAYAMMPYLLKFLMQTGYQGVDNTWNIREYIGFLLSFIATFGIVFELPVAVYILSVLGLVSPAVLRRYRRYAVVLAFLVAAILTPPDPFSQIAMALPILVLFECSIMVSSLVWRAKARRRLAQLERSDG